MSSSFALEFRAGEGGRDAERFCRQLINAVLAIARTRRDFVEAVPATPGSRTFVVRIRGDRHAYANLAGVHRVQRIPTNDRRGRRHTSTASIALIEYRPSPGVALGDDVLDVQYYRGPGPGGQHHQKNSTAVRLIYRPTGMVVTVERGRSRLQNLREAKAVMQSRLNDLASRRAAENEAADRRHQIASGDRPVKQFTHNDQRQTVVAHGSGRSWTMADFSRGRIDLGVITDGGGHVRP